MRGDKVPCGFQESCKEFLLQVVELLGEGDFWAGDWHLWVLGDDANRMVRAENAEHNATIILHSIKNHITVAAQNGTHGILEAINDRKRLTTNDAEVEWVLEYLDEINSHLLKN